MKRVQEKYQGKIYVLTRKEKFSYYYFRVSMTSSECISICIQMEKELLYLLKVISKETRTTSFRSSLPNVYCKIGVRRNFVKFTEKYLCQSLFFKAINFVDFVKFRPLFLQIASRQLRLVHEDYSAAFVIDSEQKLVPWGFFLQILSMIVIYCKV